MKHLPSKNKPISFFILWLFLHGSIFALDWKQFKVSTEDNVARHTSAIMDSNWPTFESWYKNRENRTFKGNLWLRGPIVFDEVEDINSYALAIVAVASCEVYLDGQLIASNGRIGNSASDEVPGQLIFVTAIPPDLHSPGEHHLALRFANHHGKHPFFIFDMGYGMLNELLKHTRSLLFPLMLSSAFFFVAIYFLLSYLFSLREQALLVFALLSALVGILFIVEHWRLVGYTYSLHHSRLLLTVSLSGVINFLLSTFIIMRHQLSPKYLLVLPVLMVISGLYFNHSLDGISLGFFLAGLPFALLLCYRAFQLGRNHAAWDLAGISLASLTLFLWEQNFLEGPFYACFIVMILLMMISLGLQIRQTRNRYQEARLTSARLETELLKKHIQPHFMLNTLTAAMEWIEQDPPAAVNFIESLSEEMRALFKASGRKLIPLEDELDMCRAHLETQRYRTGLSHNLLVRGNIDGIQIPPAVILTLLENGLTHGQVGRSYQFELEVSADTCHFQVNHQEAGDSTRDGTGSRYIRARLEESFPNRWHWESYLEGTTWHSIIHFEASGN